MAQMVALGGNKLQVAVHVYSGGFGNFAAADAQNLVGNFALGHRLAADGQRVAGFHIPGEGLVVGSQQRPGGVDTGHHVGAGVVEIFLAGNVTDGLPVDHNAQYKGQRNTGAHQYDQPGSCNHRQKIAQQKAAR